MADVFISYKREEIAYAQRVADALAAEGFTAFFDAHDEAGIQIGETWDKRLERELAAAKAVVVLWSRLSVASDNVRDEARRANQRGILFPARLGSCDIPLGLGTLQTANLEGWSGDRAHPQWRLLIDQGVARKLGRKGRPPAAEAPTEDTRAPRTFATPAFKAGSVSVPPVSVRIGHDKPSPPPPLPPEPLPSATPRARPGPIGAQQPSRPKWLLPAIAAAVVLMLAVGFLILNGAGTTSSPQAASRTGAGGVARAPGSVFRDCADVCPEMVVIPAGSFVMGSPVSEPGRESDEGPQHTVNIASFAAGKYEVTFAEWDACAAGGGCRSNPSPSDEGWGRGRRPVINVSWNDAQEYVRWLSQKTGKRLRLMTEAEWEYAARAGTEGTYYTGNSISASQANFNGTLGKTQPVGSYAANAFGLFDTAGNVLEWVEDCYTENYSGAPADGSAFVNQSCSGRVLRGGSWVNGPEFLRSALRNYTSPRNRYYGFGFRVARTL